MEANLAYNAFEKISQDCFKSLDKWSQPSGEEVRIALRHAGLTAEDFAKIIGVEGRTVRRWTSGEIMIPYASWCLLSLEAGQPKFWGMSENTLK